MPPSMQDWLSEDHLAWFILAAAEELELSAFYASYRSATAPPPRSADDGRPFRLRCSKDGTRSMSGCLDVLGIRRPNRGLGRQAAGEPALRRLPRRRRDEGRPPFGSPPKPYSPPEAPDGKINTTDPAARRMKFAASRLALNLASVIEMNRRFPIPLLAWGLDAAPSVPPCTPASASRVPKRWTEFARQPPRTAEDAAVG